LSVLRTGDTDVARGDSATATEIKEMVATKDPSAGDRHAVGTDELVMMKESRRILEGLGAALRLTLTPRRGADDSTRSVLEPTLRYAVQNYRSEITVDDIARAVGLSKFHLIRKFRQEAGITPGALVRLLRIVEAMNLLSHAEHRVRDVAYLVGYRNTATFSRAFQRATGTCPKYYRRAHVKLVPPPCEWEPSKASDQAASVPPMTPLAVAEVAPDAGFQSDSSGAAQEG
jgi:AraC-like DNA-binding protein